MEQRLRTAFRAVAELPVAAATKAAAAAPRPRPPDHRRRSPLFIAVVSAAALALVIGLALAFGPGSSGPPATHPHGAAHHPNTGPRRTTTPTPPTGPLTEKFTYRPFSGATLKPGLHVTERERGTCFPIAYAKGRTLYRCGTVQPCFAGSKGTHAPLACPVDADPTTNDVVLWTATPVRDTGFEVRPTKTPWAMEIPNGVVCSLVSAAWSGLGPFACAAGKASSPEAASTSYAGPADCHAPKPTTQSWVAECQDQETATSPFFPLAVEKIWY